MQEITGTIDRVIYQGSEFGIYSLGAGRTIKGPAAFRVGEHVRVLCAPTTDRFGKCWRIESIVDISIESIAVFLSGNAPTLGLKYAKLFVAAFPDVHTCERILNKATEIIYPHADQDPEIFTKHAVLKAILTSCEETKPLLKIREFGIKRISLILWTWYVTRIERILANPIYKLFGGAISYAEALQIGKSKSWNYDNPYSLMQVFPVKKFAEIDSLVLKTYPDMNPDDPRRARAAAEWVAWNHNGFCLPAETWKKGVESIQPRVPIDKDAIDNLFHTDGGMLYTHTLWEMETAIIENLRRIMRGSACLSANKQQQAIDNALNCGVSIINGPAGSGKTTLISRIIERTTARPALLMAPTGKAATRITQKTGKMASTIHSFIGREKRISDTIVIVDESSMIDADVFLDMLRLIGDNCSIVLIGDANQLPPIGRGCIFEDLISADAVIPVTTLDIIYRQQENSGILSNADIIRKAPNAIGNMTLWQLLTFSDTFSLHGDGQFITDERRIEAAISYMKRYTDAGYDKHTEIQIITPQHDIGDRINERLRIGGNSSDKWSVGDKVINTENQYSSTSVLEVSNGEQGVIQSIEKDSSITVKFFNINDRAFQFKFKSDGKYATSAISLAYSITIHKSQGSEYKIVIIVIGEKTAPSMLNRRLLYTAVTRASERCIIIASRNDISKAMANEGMIAADRRSRIAERLSMKRRKLDTNDCNKESDCR